MMNLHHPYSLQTQTGLQKRSIKNLGKQLAGLKRKDIAKNILLLMGLLLLLKRLQLPLALNNIAPEHLEIMTKNPAAVLPVIKNAGAIFLGRGRLSYREIIQQGRTTHFRQEALQDFRLHWGVYDFIKQLKPSVIKQVYVKKIARQSEKPLQISRLEAHGNTIRIRMKKNFEFHNDSIHRNCL